MSPVIDVIVSIAIAFTLLVVFGKEWFVSSESTTPLFIAVVVMISYRTGMWSGRKLERLEKEADDEQRSG